MKKAAILTVLAIVVLIGTTHAVEWKGKMGIGVRGMGTALMFKGSDFSNFGGEYQPFEMAYKFGGEVRYGFTRNWVGVLSMGYANTYDDTTETSSQTFKWRDPDNAFSHLRGKLYALTANYYFQTEKKLQPFALIGFGIDHWRIRERSGWDTHTITDFSLKFGGGMNYWLREWITLDFQAKFSYGLSNLKSEVPDGFYGAGDWTDWSQRPYRGYLEPSVGITIYLGGAPDSDKDGVKDDDDQCPGTLKGALVDANGCAIDSDNDGIFDGLDLCPNTPAGVKVDSNGCPLDSDGDGVFDSFDDCPNTPESLTVNDKGCSPDSDGDGVKDYADECPDTPNGAKVDDKGCPLDGDKDGVFDGLDKCPNSPTGSPVDETGCLPDQDGDGVLNSVDECPDTPQGVKVNSVGCPTVKRIIKKINLSGSVNYPSGSHVLTEQGMQLLADSVAAPMRAYLDINISINGYTDASGSKAFNLTLSQQRAEAARDHLVTLGIASTRMTVKGFGEDPKYFIGDNATEIGKQKNRRVEIDLVEKSTGQ